MYRRILATFAILFLLISLLGCRKDVSTDTNDNQAIGNSLHFSAWEASYPADIVLLLDQSGSMSQAKNPTDPQGLRALGSRSLLDFIVQSSSPEQPNRFGVVNFGTSAVEAESVPLITVTPSDTTAINRLIARLTPLNLGSTNIYSALELGYRYFHDAGLGTARNRAIVVFTDGEPNDSRGWSQDRYFKEISLYNDRYLAPSGIKLFVIGIDADGGTWSKSIGHWKRILGDKHVFTTWIGQP